MNNRGKSNNIEQSAPTADSEETLLRDWPGEELLERNIEALRRRDEQLADTIAATQIPETVEMAVARDGSVSFRLRQADGRRPWLGYSSVPNIAARSTLKRTSFGRGNMAINGIGSGADVEAILGEMTEYQGLFVIEEDQLHLNLALRLHDFSRYLGCGQLVLLHGLQTEELLTSFFEHNPGYNAIDQNLRRRWLSDQENQYFTGQVACAIERAAQKATAGYNKLLQQQQQRNRSISRAELCKHFEPSAMHSLRAVNCTNAYAATDYYTSRDVLGGLSLEGVRTDRLVPDRPDVLSYTAQLARLNDIKPHLILLVDMLRGDLAVSLPASAVCATILREPSASIMESKNQPADRMGPDDFVFYPWQDHREKLLRAALPEQRLAYLPIGVNEELFKSVELDSADRRRYGADVVLITDRAEINPEAYQIKLSTLQTLWQAVIEEIRRSPGDYRSDTVEKYLQRAQRCGVGLNEEDFREYFTELVRKYLGPTVWRDVYCQAAATAGCNLRIWSWAFLRAENHDKPSCWQESPVGHLAAGTIRNGTELNKLYNSGRIFLHISDTGRPDSYLLDGIAAGAFFLVKSHPHNRRGRGLGEFFDLDRELITFDSPKDMSRKIGYYLKHERERLRIAETAREKLLAGHSYRHRGRAIIEAIASGLAGAGA